MSGPETHKTSESWAQSPGLGKAGQGTYRWTDSRPAGRIDRQTGRQADRHTDRQAERQTDIT